MAQRTDYEVDPAFPALPASVPLTYALTMEACLSPTPEERPAFAQVLTLLADVDAEIALGEYVNAAGRVQVLPHPPSLPKHTTADVILTAAAGLMSICAAVCDGVFRVLLRAACAARGCQCHSVQTRRCGASGVARDDHDGGIGGVQDSSAVERLPVDSLEGTRDLSLRAPTSQPPRTGLSGLFSGRPSASLPRTILENPEEETAAEQHASSSIISSARGEAAPSGAAPRRLPLSEAQLGRGRSPANSQSFFSNTSSAAGSPRRSSPKLLAPHTLPNGSGSVSTGAAVTTTWLSAHSQRAGGRRSPSTSVASPPLSMTSEDTQTAPTPGPAAGSPHHASFRSMTLSTTSGTDEAPLPAAPAFAAAPVEHRAAAHPNRHIFMPPGASPHSSGARALVSPRQRPHTGSTDTQHSLGMSSVTSHYSSGPLPTNAPPRTGLFGGTSVPSADWKLALQQQPQQALLSDASTTHDGGTIDSISWDAPGKDGPVFAPMSAPPSTASSTGACGGHSWPHVNSDCLAGSPAHGSREHSSSGTISIGNPESADRLMASHGSTGSGGEAAARRLPAPLDPGCAATAASTAVAASGAALDVFWDSQTSWGYVYRSRGSAGDASTRRHRESSSSSPAGGPADTLDTSPNQSMSSMYRTTPLPASEGQASAASTAAAPSFVDFLLEDPIHSDVAAALDSEAGLPFPTPSAAVAALAPVDVVAAAAGAVSSPSGPRSSNAPDLHPQLAARRGSASSHTGDFWDAAAILSSDGLHDPAAFASAMSSVTTNALFVSPRPATRDVDYLLDSGSGDLRPSAMLMGGPASPPDSPQAAVNGRAALADLDDPDNRPSSGVARQIVASGGAGGTAASVSSTTPSFHSGLSHRSTSSAAPEHSAGALSNATSAQTLSFFTAASTSEQGLTGTVTLGTMIPPTALPGNGSAALETRDSLSSSSFISAASNINTAASDPSGAPLPPAAPTTCTGRSTTAWGLRPLSGNKSLPPLRPVPIPLPLLLELDDSDGTPASRGASGRQLGQFAAADPPHAAVPAIVTTTSHSDGADVTQESSVSEGTTSRSSFGDPILAAPPAGFLFQPHAKR